MKFVCDYVYEVNGSIEVEAEDFSKAKDIAEDIICDKDFKIDDNGEFRVWNITNLETDQEIAY